MDGTDIARLVAQFPASSEEDRAALLGFIRAAPLVYGPWKSWKKLFKLVEAPLLAAESSEKVDVEMLGALLARVDKSEALRPAQSLLAVESLTRAPSSQAKSVTANGFTFAIEPPPYRWATRGWRLIVRAEEVQKQSSGAASLGGLIAGAIQKITGQANPPAPAAPDKAAASEAAEAGASWPCYELNFGTHIGNLQSVSLEGPLLQLRTSYRGTQSIDVSDQLFPHFLSQPPKPDTILYMKRRARRALGRASVERPELYVPLALSMWHEMGVESVQAQQNWATMDVLFARSTRWKKDSAGRPGRVPGRTLVRLRREERAPEIWDSQLDVVRALYLDANVPPQANEMALKILRANEQQIAALSQAQAARFVGSGVPILQAEGTRALAQFWEGGADLDSSQVADLLILGGGRTRGRALARLGELLGGESRFLHSPLVAHLSETLGSPPPQSRNRYTPAPPASPRRRRSAAQVLVEFFPSQVSQNTMWFNLELFFSLGGRAREWTLERVSEAASAGSVARLDDIARLPEAMREEVLQVFLAGAQSSQPSAEEALKLVSKYDANQNAVGWRFLASTAMESEATRKLWHMILKPDTYQMRQAARNARQVAFAGAANVAMWERADFTGQETVELIEAEPSVLRLFSASFFQATVRALPPDQAPRQILLWMSSLLDDVAAVVLPRYIALAGGYAPSAADLLLALGQNEASWQFALASDVTPAVVREVWQQAYLRPVGPAGVALFRFAEVPRDAVGLWLSQHAALTAGFSTEFFAALFEAAPAATQITLALEATPERWDAVRSLLLQVLADDASLAAFWRAVFDHPEVRDRPEMGSGASSTGTLHDRILSDESIKSSLERIPAQQFADFLASANPNHEPFLLRWLQSNIARQDRSSVALIAAATHPLAAVRALGLARVHELGLSVPLALRLMESNLPQPFEAGRAWFEAAERGGADERDFALALCDSPNKLVREFGRQFLMARRQMLLDAKMLRQLSEHSDAQVQAFVAEQLLSLSLSQSATDGAKVDTSGFDAPILKARGRARRAKEAVKARLQETSEAASEAETEALLAVARGRTARDREWALQQLARRAVAGAEVPGLRVKRED